MESFDYFQEILDKSPKHGNLFIVALINKGETYSKNSHWAEYDILTLSRKYGRVQVWNNRTKRLSTKTIDSNTKGEFISDGSKKVYLKNFK